MFEEFITSAQPVSKYKFKYIWVNSFVGNFKYSSVHKIIAQTPARDFEEKLQILNLANWFHVPCKRAIKKINILKVVSFVHKY